MDILIIRFSSLGDIVITTAVVEALKRHFPDSKLYYLTKRIYSQVFEFDTRIFKVIEIQGNETPHEIMKKIGHNDYDVVIDLHSSLRSILVSAFTKSKLKVRVNKHSLARRIMVWSKNRYRQRFDVLDSYFQTIRPLGIQEKVLPKLIPGMKVINKVERVFHIHDKELGKRVIGIAPGARHKTKRWNEHSYACLADEIALRGDMPIFIGDKYDVEIVERIRKNMIRRSISLVDEIDLAGTIGLISHLDGMIANDSGLMHVAGALDVPLVALFGPTHPDLGFWPGYRSGRFIHSGADCSPCSLHGSAPCKKQNRICMDGISWEEVLKTLDELMEP